MSSNLFRSIYPGSLITCAYLRLIGKDGSSSKLPDGFVKMTLGPRLSSIG